MMISEQQLSGLSMALCALFALASFMVLIKHDTLLKLLLAFPRNRIWGIVLTAAGLLWSSILIDQMTLGDLGRYKWLLYILTPLSLYLIIHFLDELLAPRALGGILMLFPTVMVDAARWHNSDWRLVVIVLAYVFVIAGIWLVLCPFKFRIWTQWWLEHRDRRIIGGVLLALVAVLLLITGIVTG